MKEVTVSFSVEHSGTRSNQIIETTHMSEELYNQLQQDVSRTGGQALSVWIQFNLMESVLRKAMPSGSWQIVSPQLSRKGW